MNLKPLGMLTTLLNLNQSNIAKDVVLVSF